MDADGFLTITGRKKDLLITAGGKNVAPSELESHLKLIEGISLAVVVGDRKPYLSALLTLDMDALPSLCARLGIAPASPAELDRDPAFRKHLEEEIELRCNRRVAPYQTIKRFRILSADFTVEGGEVTPTMKIRRNVIHQKFAAEIDALYEAVESA